MTWAFLLSVTFIGSVVQSATGFAFAMIVVPPYVLLLNSASGVQIAIILSVVMSIAHLPRLKSAIPTDLLKYIGMGCIGGFPAGIYIYNLLDLAMLKLMVAIFLIIISLENTIRLWRGREGSEKHHKGLLAGVGAISGMLGTSLAMPGPLVMAYLSRTNLAKDEIRATMISFFVFAYIAILIVQAAVIGIEKQTWVSSAYMAPAALLGVFFGHQISKKINETLFKSVVLAILIIAGAVILFNL
jgi:uncharacterized membrane protein YfcA